MGGKAMTFENGKFAVSFVVFGKKTDDEVKKFEDELHAFLKKHDVRNVKFDGHLGADVAAEKAASKKFGVQ